jgi:hypothetical protein
MATLFIGHLTLRARSFRCLLLCLASVWQFWKRHSLVPELHGNAAACRPSKLHDAAGGPSYYLPRRVAAVAALLLGGEERLTGKGAST